MYHAFLLLTIFIIAPDPYMIIGAGWYVLCMKGYPFTVLRPILELGWGGGLCDVRSLADGLRLTKHHVRVGGECLVFLPQA